MWEIQRRDEETGNGDEAKRGKGRRGDGQRTGEPLRDRTEISAIHGLDQLCLVESENSVMRSEEGHLKRVSEFYGTTFDKQSTMTEEVYAPLCSRLPISSDHTLSR